MNKQILAFFVFAAALCSGCANDQKNTAPPAVPAASEFDFASMLQNYADNILIPAYQQAQLEQDISQQAAENFCADTGSAESFPASVRDSFQDLMQAWQTVEQMQVGVLQENANALRHDIHSFDAPNTRFSPCLVDQSVAKLAADPNLDIAARPLAARGLSAIEYIVYAESLTHNCPSQVTDTQGWNDLPAAERMQQRCNYVAALNARLQTNLQTLMSSWLPTGNNYREIFVNPANVAVHLKQLSDALFYIEKEAKDAKLGMPLSLKRPGCSQTACPDLLESAASEKTRENIRSNLLALQTMVNGGNGIGFDDLLADVGAQIVANKLNQEIEAALALVNTDQDSFYDQLTALNAGGDLTVCQNAQANPDVVGGTPVCRLHGLLKRITDTLRVEFVTAINIDLPERVGGDGD